MKKRIPLNIQDYFESLMESLHFPVTRVVIFDLQKNLDLSGKYRDLNGKEWRVFRYSNNDLGFRRDYFEMPTDPNFSHIVWIIPPLEGDKEIDVSFIPDILIKADKIIDLNLTAVLDEIIPGEMWPDNLAIYHDEISNNLYSFINAIKELRIYATNSRPLNKNHLNTLILYCRYPEARIEEFLFEDVEPVESFKKYLQLVFSKNLKPNDLQVLRDLLSEYELKDKDLIPWFKEDPVELAGFIYCFDILKQYEVINPFIQLNLIHPAVSTAVPMYLELLEKKTLNNSGCLNFDFDALRPLPQVSSLRSILEESNYKKDASGKWIPPKLVATELVSI